MKVTYVPLPLEEEPSQPELPQKEPEPLKPIFSARGHRFSGLRAIHGHADRAAGAFGLGRLLQPQLLDAQEP